MNANNSFATGFNLINSLCDKTAAAKRAVVNSAVASSAATKTAVHATAAFFGGCNQAIKLRSGKIKLLSNEGVSA